MLQSIADALKLENPPSWVKAPTWNLRMEKFLLLVKFLYNPFKWLNSDIKLVWIQWFCNLTMVLLIIKTSLNSSIWVDTQTLNINIKWDWDALFYDPKLKIECRNSSTLEILKIWCGIQNCVDKPMEPSVTIKSENIIVSLLSFLTCIQLIVQNIAITIGVNVVCQVL